MKLSCDMKAFRAALAVAGRVVPAKHYISTILNVRLVTNDDRVTITGTDMDTSFALDVPAMVETDGAALIPFASLNAFCAAAKADSLSIESGADRTELKAGRSRIALAVTSLQDFPDIKPAEGELVAVDGATFAQAIRFCAAAASDEETKYYLKGAFLEERDGEPINVWGTDGHRLHHVILPGLPGVGGGGIVPTAAVQTLLSMVEKADAPRVMICPHGWLAHGDGIRAWGKMVDGTFPDVRRIANGHKNWQEFLVADRDELSSAVMVAACGAETMSGRARAIVINAKSGGPAVLRGIRGVAGVIHAGRAETETQAKGPAQIVVASPYLTDALGGMGASQLALEAGGEDGTGLLRVKPAQASTTLEMSALIMGIRASEAELADV